MPRTFEEAIEDRNELAKRLLVAAVAKDGLPSNQDYQKDKASLAIEMADNFFDILDEVLDAQGLEY